MTSINVTSVRDQIKEVLTSDILRGRYPAGTRLDENKISRDLGVSRTPVREALIALESDSLVGFKPRRGHFTFGTARELVTDSFQVLGALETLAMQLASDVLGRYTPKLREINHRLAEATAKKDQYELDHEFHCLLTEGCQNRRIQALLATERKKCVSFDGHYERGLADLKGSVEQHQTIIQLIEAGSLDKATACMQEHWALGTKVVNQWLERPE